MFGSPSGNHSSQLSGGSIGSWGELLSNNSTPTVQKSKFFQDITAPSTPTLSALENKSSRKFQRKDPAQIAKAAVAEALPNAHVLPYTWTIYFHSRKSRVATGAKTTESKPVSEPAATPVEPAETNGTQADKPEVAPTSVDSYLQTTNEISFPEVYTKDVFNGLSKTTVTIATLEQLWEALSLIRRTSELPYGSELFIFKSGVEPVWEDRINAKGGRWMFKFYRRASQQQYNNNGTGEEQSKTSDHEIRKTRKRNALIWERLVLRVLGGSLVPADNINGELLLNDISGLVLSIRRDEDIISIWNTNLCFDKRFQESYFKSILQSNPSLPNPLHDLNASNSGTENSTTENGDTNPQTHKQKSILFNDRRMVCSSVLSIIREVDQILKGADIATTQDFGSTERVFGVNFEYRLHADNSRDPEANASNDSKHDNTNGNYHGHYHSGHRNRNNNNSSGNRRYNKYSTNNNNKNGSNGSNRGNSDDTSATTGDLGVADASKLFESGSFANLGRRRRRNNDEGTEGEPKNLMSLGSRRRLQNLQKNNSGTVNTNNLPTNDTGVDQ